MLDVCWMFVQTVVSEVAGHGLPSGGEPKVEPHFDVSLQTIVGGDAQMLPGHRDRMQDQLGKL